MSFQTFMTDLLKKAQTKENCQCIFPECCVHVALDNVNVVWTPTFFNI